MRLKAILVAATILLLAGCKEVGIGPEKIDNGPGQDVPPPGYEIVDMTTGIGPDNWKAITLKSIETGCYFIVTGRYTSVAMQQIFVEKNGVSVPYCKKE